jgi:predicted Kef-type K+ transport protein
MCEINNEVERMKSQELMTLGGTLVVLGITFGEDRLIGYAFFGVGILLSVISVFKARRKEERSLVEMR